MTEAQFAAAIDRSALPDAQFFLDTCFVTDHEVTPTLLDALLRKRVVITPPVWEELQPWLKNPFYNHTFRDTLLKAEREGHSSIVFLKPDDTHSALEIATTYYVQLLGLRKQVFRLARGGLERELGRAPTHSELETWVRKMVQDRGWLLACKGRDNSDKPNLLADEITLVRAVVDGITTGVETSVLTRDRDLTEQFYKLIYLIDTHYRSMLIADAFCEQPLNFLEEDLPKAALKQAFLSGRLLHVPVDYASRVLPDDYDFVNLHAYRFAGHGDDTHVVPLGFCAEKQMKRLLEIKGRTGGRNTDRFGDSNLHLCINPKHQDAFSSRVALARDQVFSSERVEISIVDGEIALTREERHREIVPLAVSPCEVDVGGMASAWGWAHFKPDRRLGFSPAQDWLQATDQALAQVVECLPSWAQFFVDRSFLESALPSRFRAALSRSRISTAAETVCALKSSGEALEGSLARLGLEGPRGQWLRKVPKPTKEQKLRVAFDHYLALLAHRKLFGLIIERELRDKLARTPTDDEWCRAIRSIGRGGGLLRAREGRERPHDACLFDDELTVVTALLHAIIMGGNTILVTCRQVVMEQFVTLCMTLERHYRAWAMAEQMGEFLNKYPPTGSADLTQTGFDGVLSVMRYQPGGPDEMLPKNAFPVQVQCWLFEGDSDSLRVFPVAFLAERPIHRVLQIKAETGGKSTDRLGDRNLHFFWQFGRDGPVGTTFFGRDLWTDIGSRGFPADERLGLVISRLPTFELIQIENNGDGLAFPWSTSTGSPNSQNQ